MNGHMGGVLNRKIKNSVMMGHVPLLHYLLYTDTIGIHLLIMTQWVFSKISQKYKFYQLQQIQYI
jgi:hypothetical protein